MIYNINGVDYDIDPSKFNLSSLQQYKIPEGPSIGDTLTSFYNNNEDTIRNVTTGLDVLSLLIPTLLPLSIAANAYGAYGNYNQYKQSGSNKDLRELAFNGLGVVPALGAVAKVAPKVAQLPKTLLGAGADSMKLAIAMNNQNKAKTAVETMMAANGLKGDIKLAQVADIAPQTLMKNIGNLSDTVKAIKHTINQAKNWTRINNAVAAVENMTKGTFLDGLIDGIKNTKFFG